jgi:hypothetical protein
MGLLASATTDWIQAIGTSTAALLAVGATIAAVRQLRFINTQTATSASANTSQAYAVVSQQMGEIRTLFLEHPEWYPYFYEGKAPPKVLDPREKDRLEVVCEAICDFADGLVEQRRSCPSADMDWSTWEAYFRFLYGSSPLLQEYLVENVSLWPDYVLSMFGFVVVRDERTGELRSMWGATELEEEADVLGAFGRAIPDPVVAGYPWIRTWRLEQVWDEAPDGKLAASIQPPKDAAQVASLYLAWETEEHAAAAPVLLSWLLSLVGESTLVEAVDVFTVAAGKAEREGRFELQAESKPAARERFLVPMVPIRR